MPKTKSSSSWLRARPANHNAILHIVVIVITWQHNVLISALQTVSRNIKIRDYRQCRPSHIRWDIHSTKTADGDWKRCVMSEHSGGRWHRAIHGMALRSPDAVIASVAVLVLVATAIVRAAPRSNETGIAWQAVRSIGSSRSVESSRLSRVTAGRSSSITARTTVRVWQHADDVALVAVLLKVELHLYIRDML